MSKPAIYKWHNELENTGSFKTDQKRNKEDYDLVKMKKELQQLRMENDILKQAALIMGRKSK